jgi:hypothetical protein
MAVNASEGCCSEDKGQRRRAQEEQYGGPLGKQAEAENSACPPRNLSEICGIGKAGLPLAATLVSGSPSSKRRGAASQELQFTYVPTPDTHTLRAIFTTIANTTTLESH